MQDKLDYTSLLDYLTALGQRSEEVGLHKQKYCRGIKIFNQSFFENKCTVSTYNAGRYESYGKVVVIFKVLSNCYLKRITCEFFRDLPVKNGIFALCSIRHSNPRPFSGLAKSNLYFESFESITGVEALNQQSINQ